MTAFEEVKARLRIPALAAPMFLVSGPDMTVAACEAGIIGSFPANNARTTDDLDAWLGEVTERAGDRPWAVNIMVHRSYARMDEEVALVLKHRPPIVITALGSPRALVQDVQGYGGLVFADVNSLAFAAKAADAGVDALMLVTAGAGGHTGALSPFAFVPEVRRFFSGGLVLSGAIGSGRAIRAAEILGADLANLGTRLIACEESLAHADYKRMVVEAGIDDIVLSSALTGVPANWLRQSLAANGFDPANPGPRAPVDFGRPETTQSKQWRDVWSAGHGVGEVTAVEPLARAIDAIAAEYAEARRP